MFSTSFFLTAEGYSILQTLVSYFFIVQHLGCFQVLKIGAQILLGPSLCSGLIFRSGSSGSKPRIFWVLIDTANLQSKKVVPIYKAENAISLDT